jgi:hypothetical protein
VTRRKTPLDTSSFLTTLLRRGMGGKRKARSKLHLMLRESMASGESAARQDMMRCEEVDLGCPPQGWDLAKDLWIEMPIRHQLEARGRIRLEVLLRRDEGGKDAKLTGIQEDQNPLCLPEKMSSLEALLLQDVGQRRRVVDSP